MRLMPAGCREGQISSARTGRWQALYVWQRALEASTREGGSHARFSQRQSVQHVRVLRSHVGSAQQLVVVILLALMLPQVPANEIQTKFIAQENACAGGLNTITVTLQVANKLYRSYSGFMPAKAQASLLQVSKLVSTGQADTSALPIIDLQRAFSRPAVVADNVANNLKQVFIRVDNAMRAGFAINTTLQLNQEVVKILHIGGPGCNKSHVVHGGCWNEMTVARAQHGTLAAFHVKGTLVYRTIVAGLMDDVKLDDGRPGIGNAQIWFNLDHTNGFMPSIHEEDARYVQINKEIARIDQVLELNGTVGASDSLAITLPSHFSSVDDYYKNVDLVIIDRPVIGEGGQDLVLQRRKIVKYNGYTKLALFTKAFNPVPVEGSTRFHMRAIKVKRGEYDTGSVSVAGSGLNIIVTYLGQIHPQLSAVYFLNNSWSVLTESAQWEKNTGVITGSFFADSIPGQTMKFAVPLINPPSPQIPQNVTVAINGVAGVQTSVDKLPWDLPAGAYWPVVFPLLICHSGTWMQSGDITCADCVVGKYSEACGGFGCTACPATTYTSSVRQTACKDCEVGYFCLGDSDRSPCPPGQYSNSKSSECLNCTRGSYCPGAQYLVKCNPGQFMNVTGATACFNCEAGTYSGIFGAWNCTLCRNGTISAQASMQCTQCAAGKYAVGRGNTVCRFCGENTYQPLTGMTTCVHCPLNTGARNIMGVCTGACEGSITKLDCLCAPGFTRFGQTSDECVAYRFSVAKMGQSTGCPAKSNIIGVTLQSNAQLTTSVQAITIIDGGQGYADAKLEVAETGGIGFTGRAFSSSSDGRIISVVIDDGGSQFKGFPESVNIYFTAGCADDETLCSVTMQQGTIATIQISNKGLGYISGKVLISGGGGSGANAYFATDVLGQISAVRFASVSSHGRGYTSQVVLDLIYSSPTRCDENGNSGVVNSACRQLGTITSTLVGQGLTSGCDSSVRLFTSGGGGSGFYGTVTDVSPLAAIRQFTIINHGTGYTSDPAWYINNAGCTCEGVAGTTIGSFNPCVKFLRARGAIVTARPALNASLQAVTGSRVVVNGLESGIMMHPPNAVPIYAIGSPSISAGEVQSCGILTNGTALCFGKSEQYFTADGIQTWTCGYRARYYRFTPLVTRNGGNLVQLAELEFYEKGSDVKIPVISATNPGGLNPPGLVASLAADGDSQTKWADQRKRPLQFDFGKLVAIDRYRFMTSSEDEGADPLQWRIEAANNPKDGNHWIKIHEISKFWHGEYSVGTDTTSRGIVYYKRNAWTRFWTGSCSLPASQTWRSVSVQAFHGCGINSAGVGHCWGHNSMEQLMFPDAPCSCSTVYNTYCSCTSANYFSTVYRKVKITAFPGQCNDGGRCFSTYAAGTCLEQECKYIYEASECSQAGKALGYIAPTASVMAPGNTPTYPKGCYLISNTQVSTRMRFNANNQSAKCTAELNCVCKDCPSFSYITYGANAYCGGTFDTEDKAKANELVGAKSVAECKVACGKDQTCDFFTYYPEEASIGCAPCCFKKQYECDLIDPDTVIPKAGAVKSTSTWSHLATGYLHTCGITMAGALKCWGFNRDGQASPPEVMASRKWRSVTSGKFHSCGILDDLTAHCWGANDQKLNTAQVIPVPGLGSYKWRMLSAGVWHTCGITEEGDLYCWGCGGKDRLGRIIGLSPTGEDADKGQCDIPKSAASEIWDVVSASEFHTCGVTSSGKAICWGCRCNPSLCPAWNSSDINLGQCNIPAGHTWSQIAAGRRHTCGLTIHGELLCWGSMLDASKPYHAKSGKKEVQNSSAARTFDLGQSHPPSGVETWMNAAAFAAKGVWSERGLELSVRSDTIVGADYFFAFPIRNPGKEQIHPDTAVFSEGLELPKKTFEHATPTIYGGLAVTVCAEGTYSTADSQCLPCMPGTYALDCGVGACTACMPGQYSYRGSTTCKVCGLGRFADEYGSTSCRACPAGTYGPVTAAVSQYDGCIECLPGKYTETYHVFDDFIEAWQDTGDTSCKICPEGHFCPGGVDKIKCAPETYSGDLGADNIQDCLACPHGLRCNGLWQRFTCFSGTGHDNGTVFSEISSCQRACYSLDRSEGRCIESQGQNNGCSDGYDDFMCSRCLDGFHPEFLSFQCKKCPKIWYQALLLFAYSGAVLGIPLICDLTGVDARISVYLRIMIFFFQNQDLALSVNIRWPTLMITFVRALRIMDWDLMFTNPQCWFGNSDQTWQLIFLVEVCFPLCTMGLISILASATTLVGHKAEIVSRSFWRLLGFYIVWYSVPFVGTLLRAVECSCIPKGYELHRPSWDNCTFGGSYDTPGRTALTNNPYIECKSSSHYREFTFAYFFLLWVFIGIPMLLFFLPDLEPSFRNPLPEKKRTVSAMGVMKVMNIGIPKNEKSGIGKSPGTGVLQFLEDKQLEMQDLYDMGEEEQVRLSGLLEDATNRGNRKEVEKFKKAIEYMEEQGDVCFERINLLARSQKVVKDSLAHLPHLETTRKIQEAAIHHTEISYKGGLLNFVETVDHQKIRWKRMQRHMRKVKHFRGESFIFKSPALVLWRDVREKLQKLIKHLDIFRIRALQAAFTIGSILFILPGIAFTLLYIAWKSALWILPLNLSMYKNIYFMWGHYGIRAEITGEIRRVNPLYCQRDNLDNKEDIRGCIALFFRAHGEQHESTMYKVRRVQEAGAVAAIVVNEKNIWFTPKVVAENLATFQAVDIPVMGIRASDVNSIADGSVLKLSFLRDPPKLFGIRRLKALMTLVCMRPLVENYWPDKEWFEAVVWCRRGLLVLIKYLLTRTPALQACSILTVNFFYCCWTLWRPFRLEDFNRMEWVSSISCLISSIFVVSASVLFGQVTEGVPGLELNGSAGEIEDKGREWVFWSLAMANVVLLIVVGFFLAQPVVTLCMQNIFRYITNVLRPPPPEKPPLPPEDNSMSPDIDAVCFSAVHAIEEFARVLPYHSHCQSVIDVAYGVLKEQEDVIYRREFNKVQKLRRKPWKYVVGQGSAGFHFGKEIYCFRHHFGGMVIEIPSNSNGDLRFKNCSSGEILSCARDGILWKRDSFFAPSLAQHLEDYACELNKKERPVMISEAGLENHRAGQPTVVHEQTLINGDSERLDEDTASTVHKNSMRSPKAKAIHVTSQGPHSRASTLALPAPIEALYCPSRFGRWKSFCHDPDLVLAHRQKDIQVWLTRTSAIILCSDETAVVIRDGSFEPCTVPLHIGRELLHISSVSLPGASAVRAVEGAYKVCEKRRRLPNWQEVDTTEPVSAIAAIHQILNADPDEIFANVRDPRAIDFTDLAQSVSSGSEDTVVSPEKVEIDLATRRNSAFIHWKRPGLSSLRKAAHLDVDSNDVLIEDEIVLPPIPPEELNRLIDDMLRAGEALDEVVKQNNGKHLMPPDDPFSKHAAVTALAERTNSGNEEVLEQLLKLMDSPSAGVRALAIRAVERVGRPRSGDESYMHSVILSTLQSLMVDDDDVAVRAAASAAEESLAPDIKDPG